MDKRKIVAALTDSKACEDPNASALNITLSGNQLYAWSVHNRRIVTDGCTFSNGTGSIEWPQRITSTS